MSLAAYLQPSCYSTELNWNLDSLVLVVESNPSGCTPDVSALRIFSEKHEGNVPDDSLFYLSLNSLVR